MLGPPDRAGLPGEPVSDAHRASTLGLPGIQAISPPAPFGDDGQPDPMCDGKTLV
jgi:hypothetical protein